jgi:Ca2+-binding RTX toxin-like protein
MTGPRRGSYGSLSRLVIPSMSGGDRVVKVVHTGAKDASKTMNTSSQFESLESRKYFAISASFNAGTHVLTVLGDNASNTINVSRDGAGKLFVNGGAVAIAGGIATTTNTNVVKVLGQDGNDTIALDETNGVLPSASLIGGNGNDTLTGGSSNDHLFGESGNDSLLGKAGADSLFGGGDNDTLLGGIGNDTASGEGGNDRLIWNPGEGSDVNEGGDGTDTIEVNGGNVDENFTAVANGTRVRFDRVSPLPFFLDIGTSEALQLNAAGGNDTFVGGAGLAPLISLSIDGGAGNDTITGGDGNDRLAGGDGDDLINGGKGADIALLGDGDDTFVWNNGDGSDVVEGDGGTDTMVFNSASLAENVNVSANGTRVNFTRDLGNIVMDLNQVEEVQFAALGGADNITVNDLTGTDLKAVNLLLDNPALSGIGDGAIDSVVVNGSSRADLVQIAGTRGNFSVSGLFAQVNVIGGESTDKLAINGLGGDDVISAKTLSSNAITLTEDGGTGDDVLVGNAGKNTLLGGDGEDLLVGHGGGDSLNGGPGTDIVIP